MPNYYGQYYPTQPNIFPTNMNVGPTQPTQQQQIQNGGFVSVRGEQEARVYPVAPGNSIMFKDETAPYVYTKTMGFSQLDRPIFEKFKLVKEDVAEASNLPQNDDFDREAMSNTLNDLKDEIEDVRGEIEGIHEELNVIRRKLPAKSAPVKKKEIEDDE